MKNLAIASAVCAVAIAGCGGNVPNSWQKADVCLEQHPSFIGNVEGYKGGGPPGNIGTLSVYGSQGALANAYRFPSHAAAIAAEQGIGPPGPTVYFYGSIALEVNASTSQSKAAVIIDCFSSEYGAQQAITGTRTSAPTSATAVSPPRSIVACANTRTYRGVLLNSVSARNMPCSAVDSILRAASLPPTASSLLRWGSPNRTAPPGWQFDSKTSVFYTAVRNWVMADLSGSMERFTSGSRAFRFTWGHRSRWVWHWTTGKPATQTTTPTTAPAPPTPPSPSTLPPTATPAAWTNGPDSTCTEGAEAVTTINGVDVLYCASTDNISHVLCWENGVPATSGDQTLGYDVKPGPQPMCPGDEP